MNKCLECDTAFDEPREWTEPSGETLRGCPSCGGAYAEAVQCDTCCEWFLPDEGVVNHLCPGCAVQMFTAEIGVGYIESGRGAPINAVRDFIAWYYALPSLDGGGADRAADALFGLIKKKLEGDKRERQQAREAIKDYCLADDRAWTEYMAERVSNGLV